MVGAFFGYGRQAYAACTGGPPTYLCSGANGALIFSPVNEASVSTAAGFSANNNAGTAITITGDGALSFTDANASTIASTAGNGLFINTVANDGPTPGSITIDSTGSQITGSVGIYATNNGAGALSIAVNGDATITGNTYYSIYAINHGTDLTITTGAGSQVIGVSGIFAANHGTGALSVAVNGDATVTGTYGNGIRAVNYGNGLTITTDPGSHVSGNVGIYAVNHGTGALSITANGDVIANAGYIANGIYAKNFGTGSDLIITTGSASHITGQTAGIHAISAGNGTTTITVHGDVTSTANSGIYVYSIHTADITISGAGTANTVSGVTGITTVGTPSNVTLDGNLHTVTVTGTGGTAISLGNRNDTLTMQGTVTLHGDVTGGGGANTLNLGTGTITLPDSGHKTISGFQTINVTGTSVINGNLDATGDTLNQSSGNLQVNGLFNATSLTVGSGSVFGGNITFIGNLIIASGGTLAPGDPTTTNVTGNVTFNSGSIFLVQVSGTSSDRLIASGNVTIQPGATLDVVPLGSFSGSSTPFLTAGGALTGTFTTVNLNGVATTIVYDATSASFGGGGVLLAASPSALNAQALSTQESNLLFSDTVADASALGTMQKEKYVWGKAIYTHNSRDTNGNYNGFNDTMGGVAMGGETTIGDAPREAGGEAWKLGFALGQLEDNTDVTSNAGSSQGNGTFASVYGTYLRPAGPVDLFATLGVTGSYHSLDGKRTVSNSGVPAIAKSDSDAYADGAFAQLGMRSAIGNGWSILPKAGIAYTHINASGFTEQGGGLARISLNGYSFGAWKTSEGIILSRERGVNLFGMTVMPQFNLGLSQEFAAGGGSVHGSFSDGTPLTLAFDRSNTNFINTGVGLDFNFSESITGFIAYQNAYSHSETRNNAKAGVSIKF